MIIARHGDVMLRQVSIVGTIASRIEHFQSSDAHQQVPAENERVVLAEGEHSGHIHSLPFGGAYLFRDGDGHDTLVLDRPTSLDHTVDGKPTSEHDSINLPAGEYDVVRQSGLSPAMAPQRDYD